MKYSRKNKKHRKKSTIRRKRFRMYGGNSNSTKVIEILGNLKEEKERLKTLQPVLDFYKIEPSYTVWRDEVKNHKWYSKFNQKVKKIY